MSTKMFYLEIAKKEWNKSQTKKKEFFSKNYIVYKPQVLLDKIVK